MDSLVLNLPDDKKIIRKIKAQNDVIILQDSINKLIAWFDRNGLSDAEL